MDLLSLFRAEGSRLFWERMPDDHIAGGKSGLAFESDRSYVVIRLGEMYLGTTRTLWRKFSPLVHAFTTFDADKHEEHNVAGPGQLQELGDANLDRVMVFNTRLVGPRPYRGGDVSVLAGLYSVPRGDAAAALVSTVGALATLAGPAGAAVPQVAMLLKTGVDNILGLGSTKLQLGISDTFAGANPIRTGYHVGVGAATRDVPRDRLWIRDGRLVTGPNPIAGTPYGGHDYFVLQIEAPDRRADWPGLPGLLDFEGRFSSVLADGQRNDAAKRSELGAIWQSFSEALTTSPYLTRYDAGQIANDVQTDLKKRLDALGSGNPFETRGFGSDKVEARPPDRLDFGDIPQYGDARPETGESALASATF
jgi:hypothetical protein